MAQKLTAAQRASTTLSDQRDTLAWFDERYTGEDKLGSALRLVPGVSMSDADFTDFMMLNRLQRPILSDDEILVMPVGEIIDLYYSLQNVIGIGQIKPDPVFSAGLDLVDLNRSGLDIARRHEEFIQTRIYNLRTELRQITDVDGKVYRVLLNPPLLRPPGMVGGAAGSALGILGFVMMLFPPLALVGLALTVASVGAGLGKASKTKSLFERLEKVGTEIKKGIELAKAKLPNPIMTSAIKQRMLTDYQKWSADYIRLMGRKDAIFNSISIGHPRRVSKGGIPLPGNYIAINGAAQKLLINGPNLDFTIPSRWAYFKDYFQSKSVAAMVFGTGMNSVASDPVSVGEIGIGLGILALLLL